MHNINYPGEICLAIYHVVKHNPALIFKLWRILFCVFVFLGVLSTFYMGRSAQYSDKKRLIVQIIGNPNVFFLLMAVSLVLFRIPNLIAPEQNPDEAHYIAAAASFYNGGVWWKDVGQSHGPLIALPLCLMNIFADGLNYTSIRIFGLLCVILSIYFVWKTLARLYSYQIASVITLPFTIFFASANHHDMVAYNSEHVPMLLTAIGLYLLFTMRTMGVSRVKIILLGFFLGLLPYSKTQAVYLGFVIGILAMTEIMINPQEDIWQKAPALILLILSALLPTLVAALYVIKYDALAGFWRDNVSGQLLYVNTGLLKGHVTGLGKIILLVELLKDCKEMLFYVLSSVAFVTLIYFLSNRRNIAGLIKSRKIVYATLVLATAYYTVVFPGNKFHHYLLLFIVPFTAWVGIAIGELADSNGYAFSQSRFYIGYLIILIGCSFPGLRYEPRAVYFVEGGGNYKLSEVAQDILKYSHPNEKMSIWGWSPFYFVQTGLVQGNYGPILPPFYFAIDSTKRNNPYLAGYVAEMERNKPVIFLDAVAPGSFYYDDTATFRHEFFPVLNNFVSKNYQLVNTIKCERVYVLNSRLKDMRLFQN